MLPFAFVASCMFSAARAQSTYEVLVNSRGTNAVHRYDASGTFLGEFVTSGSGGLIGPEQVLFHPDGSVLVTGFGNTAIKRYHGITGIYVGDFSSGYTLETPSKMSIGPDSLIYVTQWGTVQQKVVRFDLSGNFVDEFTSIDTPNGLGHFWDVQGRFYLSVYGNGATGTVQRFAADGTFLDVFINSAILQGPTDIWQEANGDVLVQDWTVGNVLRYDSTGGYLGVYISGLTNPEGHAFLPPNGDLLMGDWGEDAVHWFDALGNAMGYFTNGNGLTDPNGVYVREVPNTGIAERAAANGTLTVVPTVGSGPFDLCLERPAASNARFRVLDAMGRVVEERSMQQAGNDGLRWRWMPAAQLAPGRYTALVLDGSGILRAAIVITGQ